MKSLRKREPKPVDEAGYHEPDMSSPYASYEAAWRAEIETQSENEQDASQEAKISIPIKSLLTPRRVIRFLIFVLLLALLWAVSIGPLAPLTKSLLSDLPQRIFALLTKEATPTLAAPVIPPSETLPPETLPPPTATNIPLPTVTSTSIPSPTQEATSTPELTPTPEPSATPTSEVAGCVPAETVSLSDVGKTLCVTGRVIKTNEKTSYFSILVGNNPDSFFFVSYERSWKLNKGQCVYATGEIIKLGQNPIMLIGYADPINKCPAP